MNIAVAGIGYVGSSNPVLLSQFQNVIAYDIDKEKVNKVNSRISPIEDSEIEAFFKQTEKKKHFFNSKVIDDLSKFKKICDVIVANRLTNEILDVEQKVYTRDVFNSD